MKTRFLFFALIIFVFTACKSKVVQEVIESYPDGSPKVVRFFKEDDKTKVLVKEILYYPNHQKYMEGEYKNDKRDGLWVSWYQNGNKWSEGEFKDGLDEGYRHIFHENGKKQIEGFYTDGKKSGIWKFFDDNGNFVKEENCSK
jgi:antitoxin component YwqK of YwqJK toxin-antitoxin module